MVCLRRFLAFRNGPLRRKAVSVILGLIVVTTLDMLVSDGTFAELFTSGVTISSAQIVKSISVGVYQNRACTKRVLVIDWGLVEPGSTKGVTVFVRNEGNVAVRLSLEAIDWGPSNASDFVRLAWDYDGKVIKPRQVIRVVLALSVSPSMEGISAFSFNIVIVAW